MGNKIKLYFFATVIMFVFFVKPGYSDVIRIEEFTAPPAFDASEIHYPSLVKLQFDAVGWLDGIFPEANRILINDQPFFLADSADLFKFSVGMMVGAKVNQDGKVTELQRVDSAVFETE